MAALRPECRDTTRGPSVTGATAYLVIHEAVADCTGGLIHGRLHQDGKHCAIGCYFDRHPNGVLQSTFIDEVAAVNDAVPWVSPARRRAFVLRWLRWKLTQFGMPGFRTRHPPVAKEIA